MQEARLLTSKELAKYLNVSWRHLANLCVRRQIPFYKLGKLKRFDPKATAEVDRLTEAPFVDLATIIKGGLQPEIPTVARVLPTKCLLYAGRLNEIHGEPAVGKTNIALRLAMAVMMNGGHVLYIDPEDTAVGTIRRLVSFGADMKIVVGRFHYLQDPTPEEYDLAILWALKHEPTLVCLDGLAEALAAECKDENNPIDVLTFFRERMRPFTKNGVAVLIADHVTKSTETRGRWARGSSAKLGRYDGASYSAELMQGYSPVVGGKVRLRVSKDRNGGVGPCGQIVAEITFTPLGGDRTDVAFEEPVDGKPFKPTAIMAKVCEHLASWPNASKNDLRRLGKSQYVDQAIDELVAGGFLAVSTKGQRMSFTLLKHYSEEEA